MASNQIATFELVSFDQFSKDYKKIISQGRLMDFFTEDIEEIYRKIKIPSRATSGSAGYDFYLPFDIELNIGEFITIPTGIRCKIEEGFSLDIYPKSGLGFKNFTTIANTVGIIDSDYYNSDNEGHIMVKLINKGFDISHDVHNPSKNVYTSLVRNQGESFVQGIFHQYFCATNDDENTTMKIRNGGFDSTK